MAREIGDTTTWDRLRTVSESQFEPRYLGDGDSRFAFWLGETSPWPRGQINATMMMIECAAPGAWSRVFSAPNTSMYDEPTVRDLDYPRIGVRRTHHDERRHVLEVDTYAATASQRRTLDDLHRRQPAAHDTSIKVDVDGRDCDTWGRSRRGAVAIDLTVGTHRISLTYA